MTQHTKGLILEFPAGRWVVKRIARLLFLNRPGLDCVAHTAQFSLAVRFHKCVFRAK